MSFEGNFRHICTVRRYPKVQSTTGEEKNGTPSDVTDIPCLFGQPKSGRALTATGKWVTRNPTVLIPGWVDVKEGDIVIGTYAPGYEREHVIEAPPVPVGLNDVSHYIVEIKAVS